MPNIREFASPYYESHEFNVTNLASDYDVAANVSGWGDVFDPTNENKRPYPTSMTIRTNQTITVKINGSSEDGITIAATDSPMVINGVEIRNLFVSNSSGSTAAVKILLQ